MYLTTTLLNLPVFSYLLLNYLKYVLCFYCDILVNSTLTYSALLTTMYLRTRLTKPSSGNVAD